MWIKDRKFYNNLQHSDKLLRSGLPKYFTISGNIISLLSDEQKRWSSLKIIGLIVVIGIVGGVTGILAY